MRPRKELEAEVNAVPALPAALPCPRWLKGQARKEWLWIAPKLARYRILADVDRTLLETYCVAYARWREAEDALAEQPKVLRVERKGRVDVIKNPWLSVAKDAFKQLQVALLQLGMSPVARAMILARAREYEAPTPQQLPAPNGHTSRATPAVGSDPLGILG